MTDNTSEYQIYNSHYGRWEDAYEGKVIELNGKEQKFLHSVDHPFCGIDVTKISRAIRHGYVRLKPTA